MAGTPSAHTARYYFSENLKNFVRYFELEKKSPAEPEKIPVKKFLVFFSALALAVTLVYSNHFHNAFHFDDMHTIVNNSYVQDIKNIPLFFKDGRTFSSLPSNQSYRPMVTTTLAIDYWLGGGLNPFYFHVSQFVFFLAQGLLLFFLFYKIFSIAFPHAWNFFVALLAAAWYLLHPANAETINYIIARGDSLSTFFVVLAFVMYMYSERSRKYFLYLIPVALGVLTKLPAVMFAPLLFIYIAMFEKKISFTNFRKKENLNSFFSAVKLSLPAFIFCGACYLFQQVKQPPTWVGAFTSRHLYLISQPYIILHYFKTFFLPFWLSADTDWQVFDSVWNFKVIIGFLFVAILFFFGLLCSRYEKLRPVSFGIFWFFLALLPSSSIFPLSEVMNDHRIFFPYIGLALSVCWLVFLFLQGIKKEFSSEKKLISISFIFSLLLLSAYAYGTRQRNKVWETDESLWYDVSVKSPNNGRGLMNYGLVLMGRGDYKGAEKYFTDALKLWPYYAYLHVNMGILKDAMGNPQEAEPYFKNAISYRGDAPDCYYYYARFLNDHKRTDEAIALLEKSLKISHGYTNSRYMLLTIYFNRGEFDKVNKMANELLSILPNDEQAKYFLNAAKGKNSVANKNQKSSLEIALENATNNPTPENYIQLSLEYYNAGKYEECISACEKALKLKPDYDLAYNNICSAYNILGNWDKAIEAGEKAVHLNPTNQLAKNNLRFAIQSKQLQKKK
ncbi:MAG: tetratricopeptide repeat protein [Bacteroidetes bacterium]|nr:tetratricopeptide repeat protein [Bacteroidota bacterium]